jgi:hypothetical protein
MGGLLTVFTAWAFKAAGRGAEATARSILVFLGIPSCNLETCDTES